MAKEWLDQLNAEADLMPNAGNAKTVDEIYKEHLQHQVLTGEIERSTYSNSLYSYNKYIKPYLGDYVVVTVDKTIFNRGFIIVREMIMYQILLTREQFPYMYIVSRRIIHLLP